MKTKEFLLTKPFVIKEVSRNLDALRRNETALRPIVVGICGSDLHYYLGHKDPKKLKERLPVALLHEGVVEDIRTKEKFVVVPLNACKKCLACKLGMPNLCNRARFMGSTAMGLTRIPFIYNKNLLLKIPKNIPLDIAAMCEPLSICLHALNEVKIKKNDKVAIIGDGPMGLFSAMIFSFFGKIQKKNFFVIGMFDDKLAIVKNFARTINIMNNKDKVLLSKLNEKLDLVCECVGGKAMDKTLNQAIDLLRPNGTVLTIGLSDDFVPVQTSKIVNKGLKIIGTSRSQINDYKKILTLMRNKRFQNILKKMINKKNFKINKIIDLKNALDFASDVKQIGRVMLYF